MSNSHLNEWDVLQGIARFITKHGRSPTIRELKIELGYGATGRLWEKLDRLAKVGVIEWPTSKEAHKNRRKLALAKRFGLELPEGSHRRVSGGIVLKVPLVEPTRIPIVNAEVPGSRCVEVHANGRFFVDGREMAVVPIGGQDDRQGA